MTEQPTPAETEAKIDNLIKRSEELMEKIIDQEERHNRIEMDLELLNGLIGSLKFRMDRHENRTPSMSTTPLNIHKKTLQEWAALDGVVIIDPDGFDRSDPLLMKRRFTREQYNAGMPYCTIKRIGSDPTAPKGDE